MDALQDGNTSEPGLSARGSEQPNASGLVDPTLSALRQIVESLSILIEQNETIIALMLDEPAEEGDPPTHYMSGQRIS